MQAARLGHVLIVDDEAVLAGVVASYLDRAGFDTTVTGDGLEAVDLARRLDPTVVILDLGLPGLDGVEVCRQIRTLSDCYVIMLTARTEEVDVLIGLSVGADDYVTKPFSARELVARVQVMLRRPRTSGSGAPLPVRRFGELEVDASAREVRVSGAPVVLTPTEFDLLATLMQSKRRVRSKADLTLVLRGESYVTSYLVGEADKRAVEAHMTNLRRKLGDNPTNPRYIETVRGVGYRLTSEDLIAS